MTKLRKKERREKDPKAKKRLLACIHRKKGTKLKKIAYMLNENYSTIRNWIKNIETGGLERIYSSLRMFF